MNRLFIMSTLFQYSKNVWLVPPLNSCYHFPPFHQEDQKTSAESTLHSVTKEPDLCDLGFYSYFEKGCRKNVHVTIPKCNMGYDQYTVPDTLAVEPTFVATYVHGLSCHFFKFLWRTLNFKTTHNTFRDCRVHFFRQPFSKYLYTFSQ